MDGGREREGRREDGKREKERDRSQPSAERMHADFLSFSLFFSLSVNMNMFHVHPSSVSIQHVRLAYTASALLQMLHSNHKIIKRPSQQRTQVLEMLRHVAMKLVGLFSRSRSCASCCRV